MFDKDTYIRRRRELKKLVGDAQVKKLIFVPGRLLNIVC